LLYPKYPDTFWSFKHALRFISKRASFPPLGLLTVAALLPAEWEKRLIDMNVAALSDDDLKWADYVFISAMSVQKESVRKVISRCQNLGVKTVAGGPLFTTGWGDFREEIDHFVLNEAEITLPLFLEDLENGQPKKLYTTKEFPDMGKTPIPLWELVDMKKYASMNIQYSRGCPFNCEFCDIIILNGHKVRTKGRDQILGELNALYNQGWRGGVFFVDDNFIGNKRMLKREILPALIDWMEERNHPFSFNTEASVNLSDDEELMRLMVKAGFDTVFVGIETPNEESLVECGKFQNRNRDLVGSVKKMQNYGLEVQGGFIVGFDSDSPSIFQRQIDFIQRSGIVTAMVGLLNAPRETRLYKRLKKENRLLQDISGDNMDYSLNFVPKMNRELLIDGYKRVLDTIYSHKGYYERIKTFLREFNPSPGKGFKFQFSHLKAFFRSIWVLGLDGEGREYYWKLLTWCLLKRPRLFPLAITFSIYGFHFRRVITSSPQFS